MFASQGKIQLNPFASAKLSSSSTDALPSQIVKEQPIRLAEMHQTAAAMPPLASDHFTALPEKTDGGAGRDRTDDLLLAKQALSQLSYSPAGGCMRIPDSRSPIPDPGGSGWIRTIDPRLIKTVL